MGRVVARGERVIALGHGHPAQGAAEADTVRIRTVFLDSSTAGGPGLVNSSPGRPSSDICRTPK